MAQSNFKFSRATGAGAIAETFAPARTVVIESVRLHLSAAGGAAEDFTIQVNSATNAKYDTVLLTQDMNALADLVFLPNQSSPIDSGDEVDFAWANSNTRTWGLEIIYREEV